jgi:magnesium-transporting ATPase (P-type)
MGTSVAAGTGRAVVVATAMNTELGRIAGLIEEVGAEEQTPLQQKLDSLWTKSISYEYRLQAIEKHTAKKEEAF